MERHIPLTRHHLLPDCWGGTWHPNNIVNLREDIHRSFHQIFQADTPIQQLRRNLEVNKKTMRPEVYLAISDTLKRFEGIMEVEVYEPKSIYPDMFLQRL
jgi:hypothetical protein